MRVFLCEKPSQGRDIARVLGAAERCNGYFTGNDVVVTWCIGHLLEAAPPEAYDSGHKTWSIAGLPILIPPERWRMEVKTSSASQYRVVARLLSSATAVVIATDADREGEMIAREILEATRYSGPIQRLWLNALNDASIRNALSALRPGDETLPLYHAALARARADWLVGINLTRLFTLLGRQSGYGCVFSIGRVQTPTLRLVVDRDREIAQFRPVPYWAVDVALNFRGRSFLAQWVAPEAVTDRDGRCLEESAAVGAAARLRQSPLATVAALETRHSSEPPPLTFDLATLQETCSRKFGFSVQETVNLAQSLYERHKAITYPRTDSGYLPESMHGDVTIVLNALQTTDPGLTPLLTRLNRRQRSRAWNSAKVTAHHGIIPTTEPFELSALSDRELTVYRLIRGHYLAQFLPDREVDHTKVVLTSGGERLRAVGKQLVSEGWSIATGYFSNVGSDDSEDTSTGQTLPPLATHAQCALTRVDPRSLRTTPPKPYTQGELIRDMKNVARRVKDPKLRQTLKDTAGIGTEATRATHVQGLLDRKYVVQRGNALRATEAGLALIDAIPSAIADWVTTAIWEQALDQIATRRETLDAFLTRQSAWVEQLVQQYMGTRLSSPDVELAPKRYPNRDPRRRRRSL